MAAHPTISASDALYGQPLAAAYRDTPRPPLGPAASVARHPVVFLLVLILCAGAGVALGVTREPVYTAQARLTVGSNDVDSSVLPAYVVATQTLAGNYSRAITSRQVVVPAARSLKRPVEDVATHISASPVPSSSMILVEATAADAVSSARMVNAAARSLVEFVAGIDPGGEGTDQLLTRYRAATLEQTRARAARTEAKEEFDALGTTEAQARLRSTSADLDTAKLKVTALAAQYQSAQQRQPVTTTIEPLSFAALGSSDFRSALQLRAFAGVIAGLLLGAALATLSANRRRRRDA